MLVLKRKSGQAVWVGASSVVSVVGCHVTGDGLAVATLALITTTPGACPRGRRVLVSAGSSFEIDGAVFHVKRVETTRAKAWSEVTLAIDATIPVMVRRTERLDGLDAPAADLTVRPLDAAKETD